MSEPPILLEVHGLTKTFSQPRRAADLLFREPPRALHAVRDVSFALRVGETLGIVGESGCGKSTLGRCIAGLHQPTSGRVLWRGHPLASLGGRRALSRHIQMIFQDPYTSLNPRLTVCQAIDEALRVHGVAAGEERKDQVEELLRIVGLGARLADRLPHALSGGQRQRVSIARALAVRPQLIIADEPVSALDASIQAQIINLFEELRESLGVSLIFIAHDLNVVRHISHRVAVMYLGEIVETAPADRLFERPRHPYTRALLSAIPMPDPSRRTASASLEGELPNPLHPPPGCSFSTRCAWAEAACRAAPPPVEHLGGSHEARCRRLQDIA